MLERVSGDSGKASKLLSLDAISIAHHYDRYSAGTRRSPPRSATPADAFIIAVSEVLDGDHLYALRPIGRSAPAASRSLHGGGQGAHPHRHLRNLLEGLGGDGG